MGHNIQERQYFNYIMVIELMHNVLFEHFDYTIEEASINRLCI